MDTLPIPIPRQRLAAWCERWTIVEVALFGSVLRDDFGPGSDLDVMVTFAPDARWSLFDLVAMQIEATEMFGRPVDLVTRHSIETSANPFRRAAILDSARVLDVA